MRSRRYIALIVCLFISRGPSKSIFVQSSHFPILILSSCQRSASTAQLRRVKPSTRLDSGRKQAACVFASSVRSSRRQQQQHRSLPSSPLNLWKERQRSRQRNHCNVAAPATKQVPSYSAAAVAKRLRTVVESASARVGQRTRRSASRFKS